VTARLRSVSIVIRSFFSHARPVMSIWTATRSSWRSCITWPPGRTGATCDQHPGMVGSRQRLTDDPTRANWRPLRPILSRPTFTTRHFGNTPPLKTCGSPINPQRAVYWQRRQRFDPPSPWALVQVPDQNGSPPAGTAGDENAKHTASYFEPGRSLELAKPNTTSR